MTESTAARPPGKYRHEHKYALDYLNYLSLRQKLQVVMRPDKHYYNAPEGKTSRRQYAREVQTALLRRGF